MISFPDFLPIRHSYSEIEDGNMSYLYGPEDKVTENRKNFLNRLGITPSSCVVMKLNHDDVIAVPSESDQGKSTYDLQHALRADALITNISS